MKIIIDTRGDLEISRAFACVYSLLNEEDVNQECIYTFRHPTNSKRIVVWVKRNKQSTTFRCEYEEKENEQ